MRCHVCGGVDTYEPDVITHVGLRRNKVDGSLTPYMVQDVPATVCCQCGERFFSGEVMDFLEGVYEGFKTPVVIVGAPVYSYNERRR